MTDGYEYDDEVLDEASRVPALYGGEENLANIRSLTVDEVTNIQRRKLLRWLANPALANMHDMYRQELQSLEPLHVSRDDND